MNKVFLIISREYTTRVRKKSFLIMTLLGPILFAAMMIVPIWLTMKDGEEKTIEIVDESGLFKGKFEKTDNINFRYINSSIKEAKEELNNENNVGILFIPDIDLNAPKGITFFSNGNPSLSLLLTMERLLKNEIEEIKISRSGIDKAVLEKIKTHISVNPINISSVEEKKGNSEASTVAGYFGAFLVYMLIFMYGSQVMRGVFEEKTNRIAEIIVSSVKPFQLMMGKIIGVAAVGLTQFLLWIFLTAMLSSSISLYFQVDRFKGANYEQSIQGMGPEQLSQAQSINQFLTSIETLDVPYLAMVFVIYFIGGYLLYSSLFAAIGAAIDNESDSQQFMLPITLPLIFSFVVLPAILKDPDGLLAAWMSIIPFTSPVVMMMRVPFGVEWYELLFSVLLLIGGFIFTTWVASRIYRIGILVHGTKVNFKVLLRWIFMKN